MLDLLRARLNQGHRTARIPTTGDALPAPFRGRPLVDPKACVAGCRTCVDACPTGAISTAPLRIDLAACLFCPACEASCASGALRFSQDHRLAVTRREQLIVDGACLQLAHALEHRSRRLLGRSLKLRQVSAGGCNGCEAELNATNNVVFDLGRFGVQFVASPRHADGIVVTGPVSHNMRSALLETFAATPAPRIVIAVGACALSGGPFADAPHSGRGVPAEMPIDLFVPGCPPHPLTFVDGVLRLLGRCAATS